MCSGTNVPVHVFRYKDPINAVESSVPPSKMRRRSSSVSSQRRRSSINQTPTSEPHRPLVLSTDGSVVVNRHPRLEVKLPVDVEAVISHQRWNVRGSGRRHGLLSLKVPSRLTRGALGASSQHNHKRCGFLQDLGSETTMRHWCDEKWLLYHCILSGGRFLARLVYGEAHEYARGAFRFFAAAPPLLDIDLHDVHLAGDAGFPRSRVFHIATSRVAFFATAIGDGDLTFWLTALQAFRTTYIEIPLDRSAVDDNESADPPIPAPVPAEGPVLPSRESVPVLRLAEAPVPAPPQYHPDHIHEPPVAPTKAPSSVRCLFCGQGTTGPWLPRPKEIAIPALFLLSSKTACADCARKNAETILVERTATERRIDDKQYHFGAFRPLPASTSRRRRLTPEISRG